MKIIVVSPFKQAIKLFNRFSFVINILFAISIVFFLTEMSDALPKQSGLTTTAVPDSFSFHGNFGTPNVTNNDIDSEGYGFTSANVVGLPSNGRLEGISIGRWFYRPNAGFVGTDSFTYFACASSCSNITTVTLNVVNNAPVAGDDFYIVKGVTTVGRFSANDYDSDDPLLAPQYGILPQHGVLVGNTVTDAPTFFPNDAYIGYDFATYRLQDEWGLFSNWATVSLLRLPNDDAENAGYSCPVVAQPINVINGNMWLEQTDYNLSGIGENIEVNRFYNSLIQTSGLFGKGWATAYDESIWFYDDRMIRLNIADGRAVYFGRVNTTDPFIAVSPEIYGQILKDADNTYTLTFKDGRVHKFSSGGKLLWQKDRNGNQTTLTYDVNGNLAGITDSFGRLLTVTTNSGYVSQISDSIGVVANYLYNTGGTLQSVTYADGSKYQFEYTTINSKVYLTTVKDALNNILETHQYDSSGRATTSEKQGGVERYTLDYSNPAFTTVTDALGRVTKYYFDKNAGRNFITKTEGLCGGCGGSGSEITTFEYDAKLNLTKKVDALGRQMLYNYDGNGNRLSMTDVLGTETYSYNSFGEILTRNDRMNGITTNTYNATGNLLTTRDALNNTTTLTYDARGQILTVKDALNNITTLTYDAFGRLTQVRDANNKPTNFAYDARARLTSATNALNFTTSFQYDLNNRLNKITHPDATFMSYSYDLAGRRTAMTDERGNIMNYGYDNAYRLISMTNALNNTTIYGYDLMSNLVSQTDALGNITNFEYDDFNRLKKAIYPPSVSGAARLEERLEYDTVGNVKKWIDTANRETLYDYDTANRLIKTTDALNQITQFEYNPRSQMTKVTDALSQVYNFSYDALGRQLSQTRAGGTMSYEYDAVGNRTKRTDYVGRQTSYEYDVLNRLKKINYLLGSGNPTPMNTASYNYDDLSRLTSAVNEAGTVSFTYDNRNRMKTTTDVFGHLVEYNYDANSNRTQLKLDGAVNTNYAYDVANRLTTLTDEANQNFSFGYDIANRLVSKTLPNNITMTYNYDGMSRLTRLKHQSQTATLTDNNFTYNPANQISQIAELAQTKNFTYDNIDRLTNMTSATLPTENYAFDSVGNRTSSQRSNAYGYQPNNKLTSTQTATYAYNANGNMLSKSDATGFWVYGWDYENRMITARKQNKIVRYQYDALGRRVFRQGKTLGSTKFTYDGLDVLMDDGSEGIIKYQNGLGIDNKLKMITNGQAKYFLQDHLGSTVGLADSSGNVVSSASYDSFGNSTNNLTTRYQFTGREYDSFTGLHYYRTRWYDANLGRFISEDPIGLKGGINWFAYVENNPIMRIDPTGQDYLVFENGKLTWVYENQPSGIDVGGIYGVDSPTEIGRKFWNANTGCGENCPGTNKYFPIPRGTYYTAPNDKTDHTGNETAWGPFSYRLHEGLITRLFNRWAGRDGGFHIHGGYNVGTAGCIEFANYDPEQNWLKEFDGEIQRYGKEITLYVY